MRKIFQSLQLQYKGQPTISLACDGVSLLTDETLPNHIKLKKRNIQLPPLFYGEIAQLNTAHQGSIQQVWNALPEEQFVALQLLQFYEVKFTGTVNISLFLDGIAKVLNGGSETVLTLSPRGSRTEDTRRIYYPALSFGYVPQLQQIVDSSQDGQVLYATPRALPAKYFKGLREHGQIQVTYQGSVNLSVYLDGQLLSEYPLETSPDPTQYKTIQEYLPAGSRGNIIQWIQTDTNLTSSGEVAMFETDTTLSDIDQPKQEL